jgi:hypothetical protein
MFFEDDEDLQDSSDRSKRYIEDISKDHKIITASMLYDYVIGYDEKESLMRHYIGIFMGFALYKKEKMTYDQAVEYAENFKNGLK